MHVAARLEDAHHRPVAVPEADLGTDAQTGELLGCLLAYDHLTHAPLEAPPTDYLELVADREGHWLYTAEWHVIGVRLALARQIDHHHQFGRREWMPLGVAPDPA